MKVSVWVDVQDVVATMENLDHHGVLGTYHINLPSTTPRSVQLTFTSSANDAKVYFLPIESDGNLCILKLMLS